MFDIEHIHPDEDLERLLASGDLVVALIRAEAIPFVDRHFGLLRSRTEIPEVIATLGPFDLALCDGLPMIALGESGFVVCDPPTKEQLISIVWLWQTIEVVHDGTSIRAAIAELERVTRSVSGQGSPP